jgi:hypothetical protein
MAHDAKIETLNGSLQQLLFSPKGGIEGLLLTVGSDSVQVSMAQGAADGRVLAKAVGKPIQLTASADHSPKSQAAAVHEVYKLKRITRIAGRGFKSSGDPRPISGRVAAVHYAKHGEPNGVMLESGEFIHTRPPGMKKLKLGVGAKVVAHGELRMTVLGTPLVEAGKVNGVTLD